MASSSGAVESAPIVRVIYRWTVEEGPEEAFVVWLSRGTTLIREEVAGAMGSMLLRPAVGNIWAGVARWRAHEAWAVFRATTPEPAGDTNPWRLLSAEAFHEVENQTID